ncbi:Membrin-11 [Arthrobotrys entomopaga]|nr:Membrin-11 [Arthrobotrys entomopaga]
MNSLFNSALKQSQALKRDLDHFEESSATSSAVSSSAALQGQISASLASFNRTIDDYDSMAKRELIPAKQEKAKERVRNFRQQYSELKDQFDKFKSQVEAATVQSNYSELSGRRGHSSATPDNPYSYSTNNTAAANRPPGSTAFGAPLTASNLNRESHALNEQNFLSRTNDALDEFLARGRAVQEELALNKMTLKGTQKKLYTVANTLGISGDTIRMIERRAKEDKWIFYTCVVVFFAFCYFVLKWLR